MSICFDNDDLKKGLVVENLKEYDLTPIDNNSSNKYQFKQKDFCKIINKREKDYLLILELKVRNKIKHTHRYFSKNQNFKNV